MTSGSAGSTLNNVIEVCRRGQIEFERAAAQAPDAHLRKVLGENAEQFAQFAVQLERVAIAMDGTLERPDIHHRAWPELKAVSVSSGSESILDSCDRAEEIALETYRAALTNDLPPAARELLTSQCLQVEEGRVRIAELRAHLKAHPGAYPTLP